MLGKGCLAFYQAFLQWKLWLQSLLNSKKTHVHEHALTYQRYGWTFQMILNMHPCIMHKCRVQRNR